MPHRYRLPFDTYWAAAAVAVVSAATAAAADLQPAASSEARAFVEAAETELADLAEEASRADWVKSTYITLDTEWLAARANRRWIAAAVRHAKAATRFDGVDLPDEVARKLRLLKLSLTLPAPTDEAEAEELTRLVSGMEGRYGRGKWRRATAGGVQDLDLGALTRILAESRDAGELRDAWVGWHQVSRPMRDDFVRFVELGNKGARGLGFPDMGAMWRSKYDVPPDAFAREVDRLWAQVRPLYVSLHAYVRRRLRETYGPDVVPERGPIPAHLLGNMWAQQWGNVYPLVAPSAGGAGLDLTARLQAKRVDEAEMVRYAERFFTSLGFAPLPETFWERSQLVKPRDREVVCHASAWNLDHVDDLRIKMCIEITGEDFATVHHELGHNFYQRAYNRQPFLFRDSANDGFHEAIGDTVALSITPAYLKQAGLIDAEGDPAGDVGLLLEMALDKIAFLPFGLVVDKWRWDVFSGKTPAGALNAEWWRLREAYQGVAPPVERTEQDFDPGAKYHVPANVPYARYFLAHILQFQFHRSLCQAAGGSDRPLHRCSIYGSREAGERIRRTLEMGQSRPWPDALEALTGSREMDATAILDYFAPLQEWLDRQNARHPVGW